MPALTWHLKKKKKVIVGHEKDGRCMWKILGKGWKTTALARMECSCSIQIVLCMKRGQSCTIKLFFLPTNFILSSTNIYLGSYPQNNAAFSFYNLRNMASTKTNVNSSFLYFGTFYSCDIICWVEDRTCTNVALGPVGRWLCLYLGNQS